DRGNTCRGLAAGRVEMAVDLHTGVGRLRRPVRPPGFRADGRPLRCAVLLDIAYRLRAPFHPDEAPEERRGQRDHRGAGKHDQETLHARRLAGHAESDVSETDETQPFVFMEASSQT